MGSRRGHLALAAAVLAIAAVVASTASGRSLRVLIKHTPNKTESNRTRATINAIVIHDTEGRFIGSVRFLSEPAPGAPHISSCRAEGRSCSSCL